MGLFVLPRKISAVENGSNINSGKIIFNFNKYNIEVSANDNSFNVGDGVIYINKPLHLASDNTLIGADIDKEVVGGLLWIWYIIYFGYKLY